MLTHRSESKESTFKNNDDSDCKFVDGVRVPSNVKCNDKKDEPERTWIWILLNDINWFMTTLQIAVHVLAIWGAYRSAFYGTYKTIFFIYFLGLLTAIGALAGAHRLYSHRSYKVHWTFQWFLLLCQTISGQGSAIRWAREHRTHHKYNGTNADPANINRGFFYAHMGWILLKTHPDSKKAQDECNLSDLFEDPAIRIQYDYYEPLMLMCNVVIPTIIPMYFFGENFLDSFLTAFALRYVYTLHIAFCGNSVAHYFGTQPYDKGQTARHCDWFIWATMGGAYHNFHHLFPYDYSASEYGTTETFNLNTVLIDTAAKLGLVYDRKKVSAETLRRWKEKHGNAEEAIPVRSPITDWTFGMLFSALPIWLVLFSRLVVYLQS